MARRLNSKVKLLLRKSREAAILAVDVYNKPSTEFRSYGYIVLMVVAWTSLFHAIFEKDKVSYFYRDEKDKRKYKLINGEKKTWELKECLNKFYEGQTLPIKSNLEEIIEVRNRIEHAFLPALDLELIGECHAMLLNYERLLTDIFGKEYGLSTSLAIPMQLMSVNSDWQARALKELESKEYRVIKEYLDAYRASLQDEVRNSLEFSFRVYLVPKTANHAETSDMSIEFVRYDPNDPDAMEQYEHLVTFIKEKRIEVPVANAGKLKAGEVCEKIKQRLGIKFHPSGQHVKCWKFYKIRPASKADHPEITNDKYCHYDMAHRDYVYTEEWVEFLISELSDPEQQKQVLTAKF